MGMFDYIEYECPSCGHKELDQTKAGECKLITYKLDDLPKEVAEEETSMPYDFDCSNCKSKFETEMVETKKYSIVLNEVISKKESFKNGWEALEFARKNPGTKVKAKSQLRESYFYYKNQMMYHSCSDYWDFNQFSTKDWEIVEC
jgi:DNA-directed RNA polymerase subunit RPC12/RpoP